MVLAAVVLVNLSPVIGEAQEPEILLGKGREADSARLAGLAEHYLERGRSRGRRAEAGRLAALAESVTAEARDVYPVLFQTRVQEAEAARLTGLAVHYLGMKAYRAPMFTRGRIANSLRLDGIVEHLGVEPGVE